ncbi:MAG TPA: rhodanese-like domain-containing protein [Geobacteraceae bacterium]|nr:rhodanese-like domain-containing protein [Geobacteraceae bacterium]
MKGINMRVCRYTVLLAILVLAGCASVGTSPRGQELPIEKAAVKLHVDVQDGGYKIVSTETLKKWLDEGMKLTMLSTLPLEEDRMLGTLPGALNAPMARAEKEITTNDVSNLLKVAGDDKNKTIIVYCGFVGCRRSHHAAKYLVGWGYKNVYRYPGGIIAWKEAGYPLVKLPPAK